MTQKSGKHIRVCGVGRSGSTVFGAYIAARIEGGVHVGEITRLTTIDGRKSKSTWMCSCGRPLESCGFWCDVDLLQGEKTYAGMVHSLKRPGLIIVDTSKTFPEGVNADIDIHLVKDPRATSWSWFRKRSTRLGAYEESLKRIGWVDLPLHILYEYKWFIKYRRAKTPLVLYESFVADPEKTLRWLAAGLGAPVLRRHNHGTNHGIGGNIARHAFDGKIFNEQGWKEEAPLVFKVLTTIAYAPVLFYLKLKKWRS